MSEGFLFKTKKITDSDLDCVEKSAYKPDNGKNNKKPQRVNPLNGIKNFFIKTASYYVSAVIITIFYLSCLIVCKVYPFGLNTVASYDMLAQITPFIEHLFDVLEGKSSLFYSTAVAGGADLFGSLAYCLISPFTWLFLLFGRSNVYYGVALVMPLKLIFTAFSAIYFLNKVFPKIPDRIRILYSILYAYSGYAFVANTYIGWMDFLIYLPFVVTGFQKIVREGKVLRFAISYALMIYTCFSLASFSMLIVFVIIVTYSLVVKRDEKDVLVKSCFALLIAVLLSLPVMLPALKAFLSSERNKGLFENIYNNLNVTHLYRKISYIVSDVLFVFLTAVYFIKNGVKRPIDRFLLITAIILLFPVLIDECCNLLNGGSYLSYSLRFGFLNSFYSFYVASKLTQEHFTAPKKTRIKTPYPDKKSFIFAFLLVLAVAGASLYFVFSENVIKFIDGLYKKFDETDSYEFFSVFAHSLGGLEFLAPMALIMSAVLTLSIVFYTKRLCSPKVIALSLCCLFAVQIAFYNISLVKGNLYDPAYYKEYSSIARQIESAEGDGRNYYRIKDAGDLLTADASLTTHTNSYSVFSSVIDKKNFVATDFFNYKGNGINISKSANGLFLGDMLLGYKYFIIRNDNGELHDYETQVNRSYLKKLDYTQQNHLVAYKNEASLPNAFTVKSSDLNFDGLNYAQKLNKLNRFLGGKRDICDEYDLKVSDEYDTDIEKLSDGVFRISLKITTKESFWFLNTNFPDIYDIKYCRTRKYSETNAKKLESGQDVLFGFYNRKNASYTATIKDYSDKLTVADIQKYCKTYGVAVSSVYNPEAKNVVYDEVMKNKVDYEISGGNTFLADVTSEDDETFLFLNYVKLDGHTVTVNGKKVEFIDNGLNMMLVPLNEGRNHVEVSYRSPYVLYSLYGLIGGLLAIMLVIFILKNSKAYLLVSVFVYYAALVLFLVVAGFFFIYPFALFFVKLIKLPFGAIL